MLKTNIIELSRNSNVQAHYKETEDSKLYPKLYEAVSAGCLQRIATAMESIATDTKSIAMNVAHLSDQLPVSETQYQLLSKLGKLSNRLKAAGLDGDPNSDNRGKPKKDGTKG